MSSTQQLFSSGQARAEGEARADQWAEAVEDKARCARDGASETGQHAAGGILQQTSEHLKQMAQEAADAMKNAVGAANDADHTSTTTTKR